MSAEHYFVLPEAASVRETLLKEDDKTFFFVRVTLLLYLRTQTNDKMLGDFAVVRYFESPPPVDNVDCALNSIYLR